MKLDITGGHFIFRVVVVCVDVFRSVVIDVILRKQNERFIISEKESV
jgi:hypothetical protein